MPVAPKIKLAVVPVTAPVEDVLKIPFTVVATALAKKIPPLCINTVLADKVPVPLTVTFSAELTVVVVFEIVRLLNVAALVKMLCAMVPLNTTVLPVTVDKDPGV